MKGDKYDNEKIIHSRSLRDFLLSKGATLKKTKKDLKKPGFEIYIFQADSAQPFFAEYMESRKESKDGH